IQTQHQHTFLPHPSRPHPPTPHTSFFFKSPAHHRHLHNNRHSFPTRRSSDLGDAPREADFVRGVPRCGSVTAALPARSRPRSEEHTSELQSPVVISYAVFC